ncbi:MAG: glycosyltransferase family 4 protein [Clostridium sp.]|nr:glycosyltransferase family 4 protein [Clostridium sp.]
MSKDKIVLSHSGKQHSYQVARALDALNMLDCFYTSSYITNKKLQQWLISRNDQYWTRRFVEGLGGSKVSANWRFELPEVLLRLSKQSSHKIQSAVYKRDEIFDKHIAKQIRNTPTKKIFWGFQGSSYNSLLTAKELGWTTICEQSSVHVLEQIRTFEKEKELLPEWSHSIPTLNFTEEYKARLINEPLAADYVFVNSTFSKKSQINSGIPENKIHILPLGFDAEGVQSNTKKKKTNKFLYVGRISQSKGIFYMLEAFRKLSSSNATLTLIGHNQTDLKLLKKYEKYTTILPPTSQAELFKLYKEYDALILPTILDGFGFVILEALAAGTPVITTTNSFGPEIISDGKNGFIVKPRDIQALSEKIEQLAVLGPDDYLQMRQAAHQSASLFSWEKYSSRLPPILNKLGVFD